MTKTPHPNVAKSQEVWDLIREDRAIETLDSVTDDVVIEMVPAQALGGTCQARTPSSKWRSPFPPSLTALGDRTVVAFTPTTKAR